MPRPHKKLLGGSRGTMPYNVHRWVKPALHSERAKEGEFLFTAEVPKGRPNAATAHRGYAMEWARRNGVSMEGAYLPHVFATERKLGGLDLSNSWLENAYLSRSDFRRANLRGAILDGARIDGADFRIADLRGADLTVGDFERADFRGANMKGARLSRRGFEQMVLSDDQRAGVVVSGGRPGKSQREVTVRTLRGMPPGAMTHDVRCWYRDASGGFSEGDILFTAKIKAMSPKATIARRGYAMRWAMANGVSMHKAHLGGAMTANWTFNDADMREVWLCKGSLSGCKLRGTDFRGAHLRGVYFREADFTGADLRCADISGAHFEGAKFEFTHITKESLEGAYLTGEQRRGLEVWG